jgi:hypothetical protein
MPVTADPDQLDALLDALLARASERAAGAGLVNVAGDAVVDGRAAGRVAVAPGEPVASQWGNLTFDQSAICFASAADRDAQWATPHPGAICYTEAEATHWARNATAWVALGAGASSRHACRGYPSAYSTGAAGTPSLVICANLPINQGAAYNASTGLYTCPEAGLYLAICHGQWLFGTNGGYIMAMIYRNGAEAARTTHASDSSTGGYASPTCIDLINCAAGDSLAWWCQSNVANQPMRANTTESYFAVVYLGP